MRTREPLPPPPQPRSNATGTKRRPHPSAPPPPGAHGDTERGEDAEIAPESSGSQHSTAQRGASPPPQPKAFRSGSQQLPPPQKKTRSAFGTERRTDATSPIRPALRCASPAPSSAQRSSPASPGGGSRSSAPRFLLGPTRRHRSFAAIKASRRPESRASSRWDPRGGEGSPAAPPEQRSCRCWLRAPRKNQCASLIKPLHSRRALPSRPRAAKAALPPP